MLDIHYTPKCFWVVVDGKKVYYKIKDFLKYSVHYGWGGLYPHETVNRGTIDNPDFTLLFNVLSPTIKPYRTVNK
jgi:hypothetical protein